MSYEEKGTWVYLLVQLITFPAYVVGIVRKAGGGAISDVNYVPGLLWIIGIAIGLSIVGRVAIEIATPSETTKLDVRDKEINRLAEYTGGVVLSVSMVAPLGLAMREADHFWIANAIYVAFVLSSAVTIAVKLRAYRRGF